MYEKDLDCAMQQLQLLGSKYRVPTLCTYAETPVVVHSTWEQDNYSSIAYDISEHFKHKQKFSYKLCKDVR